MVGADYVWQRCYGARLAEALSGIRLCCLAWTLDFFPRVATLSISAGLCRSGYGAHLTNILRTETIC